MICCLLGLFDINMPLLYGEGEEKAFLRLQLQILRQSDDWSIFGLMRDGRSKQAAGAVPSRFCIFF
jgi:hypothetical protein